jgi:hypothetical protein
MTIEKRDPEMDELETRHLEQLLGTKIIKLDFKPMLDIELKDHETAALTDVNAKVETQKAAIADAQKRMQQAQTDIQAANQSLYVATIEQATIFDLVLRRADCHGKQFWYSEEQNSIRADPN